MVDIDLLTAQPALGDNARRLRQEYNITVTDMARRAGVSRQAVYNFENGIAQSMSILQEYLKLKEVSHETDHK